MPRTGGPPSPLSGATPLSRRTRDTLPTGRLSPVDEAELGRLSCARSLSALCQRCTQTSYSPSNMGQGSHTKKTKAAQRADQRTTSTQTPESGSPRASGP